MSLTRSAGAVPVRSSYGLYTEEDRSPKTEQIMTNAIQRTLSRSLIVFGAFLTLATGLPAAEPQSPAKPRREPDVIYVPTPQEVVDAMLKLANVKPGDVVYDLGCGDGRLVVTAAKKFGARGVGVDINPERIEEATANAK